MASGMQPMAKVPSAIRIIVVASTLLRPIRSASGPKNSPPKGRTRNATANSAERRDRAHRVGQVGEEDLLDGRLEVGVDAEVVPLGDVADRGCADRPPDHARFGDRDVLDRPVAVRFLRGEHRHVRGPFGWSGPPGRTPLPTSSVPTARRPNHRGGEQDHAAARGRCTVRAAGPRPGRHTGPAMAETGHAGTSTRPSTSGCGSGRCCCPRVRARPTSAPPCSTSRIGCGLRGATADVTFTELAMSHQTSFDEPALIQIRQVRHREIDYEDLTLVDHLVRDLVAAAIDRDEARSRLARIVSSGHRLPRWAVTAGLGRDGRRGRPAGRRQLAGRRDRRGRRRCSSTGSSGRCRGAGCPGSTSRWPAACSRR